MNKRKSKTKTIVACVLYSLIIVATVYSVLSLYFGKNGFVFGSMCFRFFTIDSNILMGICSIFSVIFLARVISNGNCYIPKWISVLTFIGTAAVTLTFVTVMVFLGPTMGYGKLFTGGNLFMHLLTPLASIFLYCFLLPKENFKIKYCLLGLIPTLLYGIVYVLCVFVFNIWEDFYGFNMGGMWYVIFPSLILGSTGICFAIYGLEKLLKKKE